MKIKVNFDLSKEKDIKNFNRFRRMNDLVQAIDEISNLHLFFNNQSEDVVLVFKSIDEILESSNLTNLHDIQGEVSQAIEEAAQRGDDL